MPWEDGHVFFGIVAQTRLKQWNISEESILSVYVCMLYIYIFKYPYHINHGYQQQHESSKVEIGLLKYDIHSNNNNSSNNNNNNNSNNSNNNNSNNNNNKKTKKKTCKSTSCPQSASEVLPVETSDVELHELFQPRRWRSVEVVMVQSCSGSMGLLYSYHPCVVYLSTFGWLFFMVNVGEYIIHTIHGC